jgi:hypothetical protein
MARNVKSRGERRRERARKQRLRARLTILVPVVAAVLIGIGALVLFSQSGQAAPTGSQIQLAPVSKLDAKVRSAPPVVQEAYRFAIANPEVLSKMPCYCGCGNMGHMDNLDCFVQDVKADGSVVLDYHALG